MSIFLKRLILSVIGIPTLIGIGLLVGSYFKVYTATEWVRLSAPDGSWAAAFPSRPILRKGPAPEPFQGEMQTWSLVTSTASYDLAILPPQDPKLKLKPLFLAAATATSLDGQLQLFGESGRFTITTSAGTAVEGRILVDANGNIYRALASTSHSQDPTASGAALFLNGFAVRGSAKSSSDYLPR